MICFSSENLYIHYILYIPTLHTNLHTLLYFNVNNCSTILVFCKGLSGLTYLNVTKIK